MSIENLKNMYNVFYSLFNYNKKKPSRKKLIVSNAINLKKKLTIFY